MGCGYGECGECGVPSFMCDLVDEYRAERRFEEDAWDYDSFNDGGSCRGSSHGGSCLDGQVEDADVSVPEWAHGALHWSRALESIGEDVSIYGEVIGTVRFLTPGSPLLLTVGAAYPDKRRVEVAIWERDFAKFFEYPGSSLLHKKICVTGRLIFFKDAAEIIVRNPEQIRLEEGFVRAS